MPILVFAASYAGGFFLARTIAERKLVQRLTDLASKQRPFAFTELLK